MIVTAIDPDAELPALDIAFLDMPTAERLAIRSPSCHRPRFLMLYGSLRERSYSRLLTFEASRLLEAMGGDVKVFDPAGLPMPDGAPDSQRNAVNQMRVLGRWMRMITIPNQSSVAKAFNEFDEDGRMKPSEYYDRVVDAMEELMKFTLLTRDVSPDLVDCYSERKETAAEPSRRVNQTAI